MPRLTDPVFQAALEEHRLEEHREVIVINPRRSVDDNKRKKDRKHNRDRGGGASDTQTETKIVNAGTKA